MRETHLVTVAVYMKQLHQVSTLSDGMELSVLVGFEQKGRLVPDGEGVGEVGTGFAVTIGGES